MGVQYMKSKVWRLDPLVKGPPPLEDTANQSTPNVSQALNQGSSSGNKIGGDLEFFTGGAPNLERSPNS